MQAYYHWLAGNIYRNRGRKLIEMDKDVHIYVMLSPKTEANYKIHYLRACFPLSVHIIYSWNPEMFTHYFWNLDSCSSFRLGTNNPLPQKTARWVSHFQ